MFERVKRGVGLCVIACVSAFLIGPVWAQTSIPAPPVFTAIDANGVDVSSGKFNVSQLSAAIGPAESGLAYVYSGPAGRDSFAGTVNSAAGTLMGNPVTYYTVSIGGSSATFLRNSGAPTIGTFIGSVGQSLTYDAGTGLYTHTALDGTVAVFSTALTSTLPNAANAGNIISLTRPSGEKLTYAYRACGTGCQRLQSVLSNRGYMVKYEYSSGAVLSKVTALNAAIDACDPTADTCSFSRVWPSLSFAPAADGSSLTITDALTRSTTYGLTGVKITSIQRPGVNAVAIVYNAADRVQSVSNGVGTWTYTYTNPAGGEITPGYTGAMLTRVTDPQSHTRTVYTDLGSGQVYLEIDAVGATTSYSYLPNDGRISRIIMPEGINGTNYSDYTVYRYTGANLTEVRQVAKAGSGLPDNVITASYAESYACSNPKTCHKPISVTDARGNVTNYTYDATHGGVLTVTSPAPTSGAVQPQTRISYLPLQAWYKNGAGTLVAGSPIYLPVTTSQCATTASCAGAAEEVKTTTGYQTGSASLASNLLPLTTTSGAGDGSLAATTTMTYDQLSNLETVNGPLAGADDTTRTYYDLMRQVVGVIGPDPDGAGARLYQASRTTYNPNGQVTSVEAGTATGQAENSMSSFVPLQRIDAAYDGVGRKISDSLIAGGTVQAVTQYGYDTANRPICQAVRMNSAAFGAAPGACVLGAAGADGPDRITYNSYDNLDRLIQVTAGYGTSAPRVERTITYTTNGQRATEADGKGNLTTYEYDGFDRLAKTRYPIASNGSTSSTTDYEGYTYDAVGNVLTSRRRDGQVVSFTYDALNRVTYKDGPKGWFYYDNLGRPTYTYSGDSAEKIIAHYYDGLGRPSYTYDYRDGTWYPTYTGYDLAGRRTMLQWSDGNYVTYEYDLTGSMTAIRENGSGSGAFTLALFSYDNLGRRTATNRANSAQTYYGYDAASRLNALTLDLAGTAQDQAWTYDYSAANQIKTRTSSNDAYQWTGGAAVSRAYGANGLNQVTTAGATTFAHDGRGNLTSDGATAFGYDLDNRLTSASGAGSATLSYDPLGRLGQVSGSATARFVYSGDDLIAELNSSNGVVRRYVPGPDADEPLVWYEGSGMSDRRWLLADEHGSVVAVTNSSGAATTIDSYDEYGVPAAGNVGRFQYTGQVWLPEIGLYHYKARAYSPSVGRFLQTDPIGYGDGMNWYAYVGNDPINSTDPSGLYIVPLPNGGMHVCNASGPYSTPGGATGAGDCHDDFSLLIGQLQFFSGSGPSLTQFPGSFQIADWRYSQSTGALERFNICFASNNAAETTKMTSVESYSGNYSGAPGYVNDASADNLSGKGPLPRGGYNIAQMRDNVLTRGNGTTWTAKSSMRLEPDANTNMHGRSRMLIHGGNFNPRKSSQGCIIAPNGTRGAVGNSGDTRLQVTP